MVPIFFKKTKNKQSSYRIIVMLSAWGFILVVTSFLFLTLGVVLDEMLGTSPKLMLAMLFLAIIGCLIELFQEIRNIIKKEEEESSGGRGK
jgi:F0F1-type ATP synthase assembly protein I